MKFFKAPLWILAVSLLAVLLAPPAGAALPEGGKARLDALLKRMQETQRSIQTLKVSFVQTNDFKMRSKPDVLKGDLVLQKPATVLYRYTAPQKLYYLVKDGELLMFNPGKKQAFVQDISRHQAKITRYLGISTPMEELLKNFDVCWAGEADGVVTLQLDPLKRKAKKKIASMTFKVGEKDGIVHEFEVEELEGDRTRFAFSNWEINPKLGAQDFKVELPAGTKVERKMMDFREPFGDSSPKAK